MLWYLHTHRQRFFQRSVSITADTITVLTPTHDEAAPKVTHERLEHLHARGTQIYGRHICQHNRVEVDQPLQGYWHISSGTKRDVDLRSPERGSDVAPCAGFALDDEHIWRPLHVDEGSSFVILADRVQLGIHGDAIGVETCWRSH